MITTRAFLSFILFAISSVAFATDTPGIEKFSILGQKENLPTRPGSAHLISEYELEKFDFIDIHQVLRSVPGVNIQEEDGFGLRPNIGLRGAHPHRSRKITLMEDGVLIGPAPYSAPAAYYFPTLEKIYNIEVYKGPAAVAYGPNSVGGAINMITRRHEPGVIFDTSYGSYNFQKYQISSGFEAFGKWSVDLLQLQHDGFKTLPNEGDTGFQRQNVFVRWDKEFSSYQQELTIKWNWAAEDSRETYLGLSNDDFNINPYQRYAASAEDAMNWKHQQFFLNYQIVPSETLVLRASAYYHQFRRAWKKFDGFFDTAINSREILTRPYLSANRNFYDILRGDRDSSAPDNADSLRITNNDRSYASQGLQLYSHWSPATGGALAQEIRMGYRLHRDSIQRNHISDFFDMQSGSLVDSALPDQVVKRNEDSALAHTIFVNDTFTWDRLETSLGVRVESVKYHSSQGLETDENAFVPGWNGFYQTHANGGVLFGANKAVTLVGPGQGPSVDPEEALNLELGYRYTGNFGFETIGFYSDYTNILGTCTLSTGCNSGDLDQRFNGGEALIYGLEALVTKDWKLADWTFPTRLSLTYTEARFENSFASGLVDWGEGQVQKGDPLPYIPNLQGQFSGGVEKGAWNWNLLFNYVGSVADQAVAAGRLEVPSFFVINTSIRYSVTEDLRLLLRVDNLLDRKYAVSFRPFGLRPGMPLTGYIGLRYEL